MGTGSSYSAIKTALVALFKARPGLKGVRTSYEGPTKPEDLVSLGGANEAIWFDNAEGSFDDIINCGDSLRFDETYLQYIIIQVMRMESVGLGNSPQQLVDERAEELLFEVLAVIADQSNWNLPALNLDQFSYLIITPRSQDWSPGFLEGTSDGRGVTCRLGIEVRTRRNYL